ncbi:Plant Tudor-like protein [Forsythia ovata]|uniref:Plant Tudor-like protein n=1 Tax=Forsythia ovata TaxID=205694 RepID=A0ABD1R4R6_9LAMI
MSTTMKFKRRDRVEIASNEEGFVGSYYEAMVVTELLREEYIVQYITLLKDNMSEPLREVVFAAEVRPNPPDISVTGFKLYDLVDAFDNDGWWVRKITGKVGNKYFVYFECSSKDEFAYDFERLRVHQDWVNGNWVLHENPLNRVSG